MAKALVGHLANDHLLMVQITALKARVKQLEAEVARLQTAQTVHLADVAELDALNSELAGLTTEQQPALL